MRQPPPELQAEYERCHAEPSDINEHLPLLRELASQCEHVTEMGLRGGNGSTIAFLAAQPAKFISWDINPLAVANPRVMALAESSGRTKFEPRCGDTLEVTIEPTELLFIDTLHTARQLKAELERHVDPIAMRVKRFLVFHDTRTFGDRGEDGSEPGLRGVIRWFQKCHAFPQWQLVHDLPNNNGLTVLEAVR